MATPTETSPEKRIVDRFSNLPNEIAHRILSLLSFKDFTRVGCVSKRCRRLHLSAPSIKFCEFSDVTNISSCDVHTKMLDSFDRFLNQRGDNKMRSFHFSWCFRSSFTDIMEDLVEDGIPQCYCDDIRLNAWIDSAVRCNVEVVQLVNSSPDWYQRLPSSLLLCQSLRLLLVDGKAFIGEDVTSSTLSNLEYLTLKNVMIENKEFWKWVSYSCKCIKDLHLEDVSTGEDIIIDSSSLESFSFKSPIFDSAGPYYGNLNISGDRLEEISINGVYSDSSFMISAPNLKCLRWYGSFARQQNFGELPCLEMAEIISFNSFFKEVNHLALFDLFRSIPQVKVLILCQDILKAVLKQGFTSVKLDCVGYLRLTSLMLTDDIIPALITLLGVMPNLSVLHINYMPTRCDESKCAGFDMEFWKVQNLAFVDKIKEVTLDVCHGSNILEFARYILEHAQNLEKVVIHHFPDQCDAVMKLQSQMISNATVSFHQEKNFPFGLVFDRSET